MGGGIGTVTTTLTWHLVRSTDIIDDPCTACGSVIRTENQSLGQAIAIAGTPFALHYRSDRLPGNDTSEGLGGWTLSAQHAYRGKRLYFGDGRQRTVEDDLGPVEAVVDEIPGVVPAAGYLIASRDGAEVYTFDNTGCHLRTLDALTGALIYEFHYDATRRLAAVVDTYGLATTIERKTNGLPTAIIGPYGHRTKLVLDNARNLTSIITPAGEKNLFAYSVSGLLTNMIDPRGFSHTYEYDAVGRLLKDSDPAGGFTSAARTATTNDYTVAVSTALGRTTSYRVVNQAGGVRERVVTFPDGSKNTLTTWPDGRRKIEFGDGTLLTQTEQPGPFWGKGVPVLATTTVKLPSGLVSTQTVARAAVLSDPANPLSLVSLTDTITVNGIGHTSSYTASNRTTTVTSPLGRSVLSTSDAAGRVTEVVTAGLAPVRVTYDNHGRPVIFEQGPAPNTRRYRLAYDAAGYVQNVIDPLGRTNSFLYDAAGRITQSTLPDGRTQAIRYDAMGNVTAVMPAGRPAHSFEYDKINQVANYVPPDVGAGQNVTRYEYNADHQVTRTIRPDGQAIDLAYNPAGCNCGKLGSLITPTGTNILSYHPTTGKLTGITSPGGITLAHNYDGLLLTGETWSGPVAGSVARGYNRDFHVTAHTVNGGPATAYLYDSDGLLTQAGDLVLTRSALNSLISSSTLGGVAQNWTYNSFGEITNSLAAFNGVPLLGIEYTRDKLGRIITKLETIAGVTNNYGYGYDLAGRLVAVTNNGVTNSTYGYDANGNRLSVTTTNGTTTGTYDDQDRLMHYGDATYAFTANGELLTRAAPAGTTTYQYDALGNLLRVNLPGASQIEYLVDGRDRRIGKKVNGTLVQGFLYQDGLRIAAELDGSGNVVSRFVYGTRNNAPAYLIRGGATYRIVADHLGSPRLVVDVATGAVAQRLDYDEFGRVLVDTNPGFQPFGFAGGLYDPATGFVRFGTRDYDARTGRWTARDPILFAGGDPNFYGYVLNDPVNSTDPLGLFNPAKGAVAIANIANAARLIASAFVSTCGAVLTAETGVGAALLGGKAIANVMGAKSAFTRGSKLWSEALVEKPSDASVRNVCGVLPFGEQYDDPAEPGPKQFWTEKGPKWSAGPVEFVSEILTVSF